MIPYITLLLLLSVLSVVSVYASDADIQKVDNENLLLKQHEGCEELEFKRIVRYQDKESFDKWIDLYTDVLHRGYFAYMIFMDSIEHGQFDFAKSLLKHFYVVGPVHRIQGLEDNESVLVVMERTLERLRLNSVEMEKFNEFRVEMIKAIYSKDFNEYAGKVKDVKAAAIEGNLIKTYAGIIQRSLFYDVETLKETIKQDWLDITQLILQNYFKTKPNGAGELAENSFYSHVKSVTMIKLLKSFKIPVLSRRNSINPRATIYKNVSVLFRREVLDAMKIDGANGLEVDRNIYKERLDGDDKMTVREALMLKDAAALQTIFLTTSSPSESDIRSWIPLAIKYSPLQCLTILLEEGMPIPATSQQLDQIIKLRGDDTKEAEEIRKLVGKYRMEYYDAEGVCSYGPSICKIEKKPAASTVVVSAVPAVPKAIDSKPQVVKDDDKRVKNNSKAKDTSNTGDVIKLGPVIKASTSSVTSNTTTTPVTSVTPVTPVKPVISPLLIATEESECKLFYSLLTNPVNGS